jgi:flavin reductase (DIM6/NTAB) family NADH-FMN oxidoreductase RutF
MLPDLQLVREPAPQPVPAPAFAEAMSRLPGGVVIVTCLVGGRPWVMTVTAFMSVSADPATVLVSLGSQTASAAAIRESGNFGVSILAHEQQAIARYCATPGATKLLEQPVVPGALAHVDCVVTDVIDAGDHTLFIGLVHSAEAMHEGDPLVYHRRAYRTVSDPAPGREIRCL